jgi:hypothetical protein
MRFCLTGLLTKLETGMKFAIRLFMITFLLLSGLYLLLGGTTASVASERYGDEPAFIIYQWFNNLHFSLWLRLRIITLWPLYWIFRICAGIFYTHPKTELTEETETFDFSKGMPDYLGDAPVTTIPERVRDYKSYSDFINKFPDFWSKEFNRKCYKANPK